MILCHDKVQLRARVVEKLAGIAAELRKLNNFSSLRATITAINQAMYPNDNVMRTFAMNMTLHQEYIKMNELFGVTGAHKLYHDALEATRGSCIPCL